MTDDDDSNPPLMATYKHLLDSHPHRLDVDDRTTTMDDDHSSSRCVLPVIDLASLQHATAEQCRASIVGAASEWGFFQVTNHGVPQALLDQLHEAQVGVFRRPFQRKVREPLADFSPDSYRWGTPTATCLEQLSWSEAYHIPMLISDDEAAAAAAAGDKTTRLVIEEVSTAMSKLALQLAGILVADLRGGGEDDEDGDEEDMVTRCTRNTCFLRLNRYPACGAASGAFGLCPHTDSDFLTILHQDGVGGLQLLKAGSWVAVEPNPGALIVNVGDLLQAWSNDRYRSVEHRVMASASRERFSVAFFLCPAYDTLIQPRCSTGGGGAPHYKSFTFGEYRNQVREDVKLTGRKLGLQRFRLQQELQGGGPL
ncbi:Gibberellin 2-beta-dioxygenase 8 [Dichanthelium oligosanthes]|uniref:Gibberellin 2-beta-dioxygenase 8 n=1 Tax=Dichanthelium oligosanthes TaxID=888268 RepID=A0A1E5WJC9_9POAL|nr:Gibberellin 2-beta-dioxygenase 8 [Dichanthelium oligosanthes]